MVTAITDHVARAVARLKAQFSESTQLKGIVSALALECQTLDAAMFDAFEVIRDPNLCVTRGKSSTLEQIGRLVAARNRGTLSDASFRDLVLAQIQTNKADGALDDLIAIYNAIFQATLGNLIVIQQPEDIPFSGYYPGGENCTVLVPELAASQYDIQEQIRNGVALLKQATPAGNRTVLIVAVDPTNNTNNIFFLDSTNTDGTERMLTALDSPDTVR